MEQGEKIESGVVMDNKRTMSLKYGNGHKIHQSMGLFVI